MTTAFSENTSVHDAETHGVYCTASPPTYMYMNYAAPEMTRSDQVYRDVTPSSDQQAESSTTAHRKRK